ncbi:hypothetical protein JR316_0003847 [Psilocybe cubensis]|uniref:Mediator complex subunit 16 C-terminal domain-containing protein n=2 Tax=Psilocybe cubensis TaxID=181762 RepID=A0A8H8CMD0_PSICU|nr:hypothetical protein JR316_0003847 [Psilocybe cubensis]KAH9484366.1 hypothetical protein JR316_0003847 [Psilocybe cubensis]
MDIIQDSSNTGPSSPQKGKGVEADPKSWRAGWWDFYPLLEHPKRPVQWSRSSVIFTAHATQPFITGRHFSSSKQFVLPSPAPISNSPALYDPPTLISISPDDLWLLAYFYRRTGEGIACLWKRGNQIDNWQVKDSWTCLKGCGIVTVSWLESQREWINISPSGPTRLPLRGPKIPVADMTMLFVTEDNYLHVTYLRQYTNTLKTLKKSLNVPGVMKEGMSPLDYGESPNHRQCMNAAIGLCYNDPIIMIASQSRRIPAPSITPTISAPPFNHMDLSAGGDSTDPNAADQRTNDWENWGDEGVIEIFECYIKYDGESLMLGIIQLSHIDCPPYSLTSLEWVSVPSPKTPEKGKIGLMTAFADFHDFKKPPTSLLNFYGPFTKTNATRHASLSTTRTIEAGVVTHIEPFMDTGTLAFAYILHYSGTYGNGKNKPQNTVVGNVHVLNIPTFTESANFSPATVEVPLEKLGEDLPFFAAISPNRKFICTLSCSLTRPSLQTHALPTLISSELMSSRLSWALAAAILSHRSTVDLVHAICGPQMSNDDAATVLSNALALLENFNGTDSPSRYICDIMGVATDIYKLKAESTNVESENELFQSRCQAAHDICSMSACITAFEDSKEGDGYDLDAVWQLIAFSNWVIGFTEKLMKACILASNAIAEPLEGSQSDFGLFEQPILLNLCHPFALRNFISSLNHVKSFREFLAALPAGSGNAQIAQSVLVDSVDYSGVEFGRLVPLLQESLESAQKLDASECRRALAACCATNLMKTELTEILNKISQSESLLNKPALFIKPYNLIDGLARLSLLSGRRKNDEKDIITKMAIPKHTARDRCLRCGGKTVIDRNTATPRPRVHTKWHLYELMWQLRCVCGGAWSSTI